MVPQSGNGFEAVSLDALHLFSAGSGGERGR
jgi:hypothetical protein